MADREYIIQVLLNAKDNMGRAFAEATGQIEAYNSLLDEQAAHAKAAQASQKVYADEISRGDQTLKRYKASLADLGLEYGRNEDKVRNVLRRQQELEQAQNAVTKAQHDGKGETASYSLALDQLLRAQRKLSTALQEYDGRSRQAAQADAQRAKAQAEANARGKILAQEAIRDQAELAKAAEDRAKREAAAEREKQRTVDALNREAERNRSASMRRLAQENAAEERQRIAQRRAEEREVADLARQQNRAENQRVNRIQQITRGAQGPANVLANPSANPEREARATRELAAARDELTHLTGDSVEAEQRIHTVRQQALQDYGFESQAARDRVVSARAEAESLKEYDRLINQVAQSQRRLETARIPTNQAGQRGIVRQSLEIDVAKARAELDEFRASERARNIDIHARVPDRDIALARAKLNTASGGGGRGGGTIPIITGGGGGGSGGGVPPTANASAWSNFFNIITGGSQSATQSIGKIGDKLNGSFGPAALSLIQPFTALILGLVATFGSLYSAVVAAATALGATFLSAMAQGIPVMGLFAASMQRLSSIFSYVQAVQAQVQQRFIAGYETARQNAMGVNQVAIAQHNYSDALYQVGLAARQVIVAEHNLTDAQFAQQQAVFQVRLAQLSLSIARRDATRQLQQLVFQETNARLAAEASTLAITDSQKALRQAIGTGGDVQQAQLQLSQAQANHAQAVAGAHNAIADAAQGSVARQQITATVTAAERGVTQARRAVVDANFALAQAAQGIAQANRAVVDAEFQATAARAAIVQARQAAVGYNVATAAQLAFLRSQMTRTERSLADNIQSIYRMFQGVHGYMRPITDAILGAFIPLTAQIRRTLLDPRIFAALLTLGQQIGSAIRRITSEVFNPQSIRAFLRIVQAAGDNLRPLANIISNGFRAAQAIIVTAIPYVHDFLGYIDSIIRRFADWANSTGGRNWLKHWFDDAFTSLKAFIGLGIAIVRLIAAVVGAGGGAKAGTNIINDLTGSINRATRSINSHGRLWKDLHLLWAASIPILHGLGNILGAVGHAFLQLGASRQGQEGFRALVGLITHVAIPAFVQFARTMGAAFVVLASFLNKHPDFERFLVTFISFSLVAGSAFKIFGAIFGPLFTVVGLFGKLGGIFRVLATSSPWTASVLRSMAAVAAPLAGIVAAFVLLAKWTGTLGDLWRAIRAPFVELWRQIAGPIRDVVRQFNYMLGAFGGGRRVLEAFREYLAGTFRATFRLIGSILGGLGRLIGNQIATVLRIISGIFRLIGDVFRGNWGRVARDAAGIGRAIVRGFINSIKDIGDLIVNVFSGMWKAVLSFFGISSPSRKAHSMGRDIASGLISGLAGLPGQFLSLGERLVRALIRGIGNLAKDAGKALLNLIPAPIRGLLGGAANAAKGAVNAGKKAVGAVGDFFGGLFATGGPIDPGGYGGGDRHLTLLESGEHVITKEEVRSAGGHEAIFSMRRALGGGGQGSHGRYATGGVVGRGANATFQDLGQQNISGTTQGVRGSFGATLANIRLFGERFTDDWRNMWDDIRSNTQDELNKIVKVYNNNFSKVKSSLDDLISHSQSRMKDFMGNLNETTNNGLNTFVSNFKSAYKTFADDTYNAFWYIGHEANQALSAFGAKPARMNLDKQPRFAGGGFVGNIGERGRDAVHAMLGRGEAVLNYAHQRVVDPALRSYYGFGMDKLFDRVRGTHAGDRNPAGYAVGGPAGGVNFYGKPDKVSPHLVALMRMMEQKWPQLIVTATTNGGHASGSYHYRGEAVDMAGSPGLMNQAASWVMSSGLFRSLAEGIHNPNLSVKFGKTVPAAYWGAATWGEHLNHIHLAITNAIGKIANMATSLITGAGITPPRVSGGALLGNALRAAVAKVASGASDYVQSKMPVGVGADAYTGGTPVPETGNFQAASRWTEQAMQIAGVSGALWRNMLLRQEYRESGYNPNAINRTDVNAQRGDPSRGILQTIGSTFARWAMPGYNKNIYDPVSNIIASIRYIIATYGRGNADRAAQVMWNRGGGAYAGGGFVDGARPIIGHVGEWVVNKAQQSKLAGWLGTSTNKLQNSLGFTGGPDSFAGGGVIRAATGIAPTGPPTPEQRTRIQTFASLLPTYSRTTGAFADPLGLESAETFEFAIKSVAILNQAQSLVTRMIRNLNRHGKSINKSLATYLANLNNLTGDGGVLTLAAAALDNYVTQQANVISLAANGIRVFGQRLVNARPETALRAAQQDLANTETIGRDLRNLQRQENTALIGVQSAIRNFGQVTSANSRQYQQLLGQRRALLNQIADTDSKIAQNAQDIIDKQQGRFQAQLEQQLRGRGTLTGADIGRVTQVNRGPAGIANSFGNLNSVLSKVGPQIGQAIAQMAQSIAQTLGDPRRIATADAAIVSTAQATQRALSSAYARAAARARRDPRWQKVADDLLGQLESATEAVVQAQAQALTDAIQGQDTKAQLQQAAFSAATAIAQAAGQFSDTIGSPAGQFAAIGTQIGLSQGNARDIGAQIGDYQRLLARAQAEGNVGATNQLRQTIEQLNTTMEQANLQTQQLITSYYQLSSSLIQSTSQSQGGFFQSAQGIYQAIGTIVGNQQLPQQIDLTQRARTGLLGQSGDIIGAIRNVLNGGAGNAFGAATGTANNFLAQALQAFQGNGGPGTIAGASGFAQWLASHAQGLSQFQAGLPQDEQTLFNNLIQGLTDNVTALTGNTEQLQQLNGMTNQQQFNSSAWSMFRQAIFDGMGALLPRYAMQVPVMDVGGKILSSGLLYGHRDETIIPAGVNLGEYPMGTHQENHFHITNPTEVADPNYLGNAIAWRISNPNSR
jgi:hypothetical protein